MGPRSLAVGGQNGSVYGRCTGQRSRWRRVVLFWRPWAPTIDGTNQTNSLKYTERGAAMRQVPFNSQITENARVAKQLNCAAFPLQKAFSLNAIVDVRIRRHVALQSKVYVSIANDVIIYFRQTANRISMFILGHVRVAISR